MRADKYFAGKFGSRTKAAEELTAGRILKNGKVLLPKDEVADGDEFTFLPAAERFVSGGGYQAFRGVESILVRLHGKNVCGHRREHGRFYRLSVAERRKTSICHRRGRKPSG